MTRYPSDGDIRSAETTMMAVSDILRKIAEKEVVLCSTTLEWLGNVLDGAASDLHIESTARRDPAEA